MGNFDLWVPKMLLVVAFDTEQSMFKLLMKSNVVDAMAKPIDVNHVFCLWCTLLSSRVFFLLFQNISNWQKLLWYKLLVAKMMSETSILWHFANPSCKIDSLLILNTYLINLRVNC